MTEKYWAASVITDSIDLLRYKPSFIILCILGMRFPDCINFWTQRYAFLIKSVQEKGKKMY